jgi:hypothetical protein
MDRRRGTKDEKDARQKASVSISYISFFSWKIIPVRNICYFYNLSGKTL